MLLKSREKRTSHSKSEVNIMRVNDMPPCYILKTKPLTNNSETKESLPYCRAKASLFSKAIMYRITRNISNTKLSQVRYNSAQNPSPTTKD